MIRAVVFDYGGTLVRPKKSWDEVRQKAVAASYRSLAKNGMKLSLGEFASLNGAFFDGYAKLEAAEKRDIADIVKYRELVDKLFPARPRSWRQRTASEANDAFWTVAVGNFAPKKDATRCLSELRSAGMKLAVISNHHNHEALAGHLNDLKLDRYFSRIFCSSKLGLRKPDPRIFEKCLSALKVSPGQAVFVGDSLEDDIGGAQRAGLHTVLVANGHARGGPGRRSGPRPDYVVNDLDEIPGIVSSIGQC